MGQCICRISNCSLDVFRGYLWEGLQNFSFGCFFTQFSQYQFHGDSSSMNYWFSHHYFGINFYPINNRHGIHPSSSILLLSKSITPSDHLSMLIPWSQSEIRANSFSYYSFKKLRLLQRKIYYSTTFHAPVSPDTKNSKSS